MGERCFGHQIEVWKALPSRLKGAFSVLIQVAAGAQGQGHIAQEFADRQAVTNPLDTAVKDVDQAGEKLVIPS